MKRTQKICFLLMLLTLTVLLPLPARAVEEIETLPVPAVVSPDQPKLKSAKGSYGQITVRWKKVKGALSYLVYRKGGGAKKYKKLAELPAAEGTIYADTAVKAGISYTYTVRAVKRKNGKLVTGPYDAEGVTGWAGIPAVLLNSCSVSGEKALLTWTGMTGISGYRILRRTDGGSAEILGNVKASRTSFTDKKLEAGHTYSYDVLALVKDGQTVRAGTPNETPLTAEIPLPAPQNLKVSAVSGRVYLSWSRVDGAEGYRVYRRPASGTEEDFVQIASLASSRRITCWDSTAVPGEKVVYMVRASVKAGRQTVLGDMSAKKSVTVYPGMAVVTGVKAAGLQDKISWKAVPGASGYVIYKKNAASGKKWVRAGEADSLQTSLLVDRDEGTTSYTVKAWTESGEKQLFSKKYMTLDNAARKYTQQHVLFLGDSITWGQTWSAKRASVPYLKRVAQLTGIRYTNAGIRGCTIARASAEDTISVAARMARQAFNLQEYSQIVLAAGTNDYGIGIPLGTAADQTDTTFFGALNLLFAQLKEQNPDAPVTVILPGYRQRVQQDYSRDGFKVKNTAGFELEDYRNALKQTAERYGAAVFDLNAAGLLSAADGGKALCDGLHPTEETYIAIGNALAKAMIPLMPVDVPQEPFTEEGAVKTNE